MPNLAVLVCLFCAFLPSQVVFAAKILAVCPTQMRSHYIVVEELLRNLAESGHEVTVVSQFPVQNPPAGYREIVIDIPPDSYQEYTKAVAVDAKGFSTVKKFVGWALDVTERTYAHPKVQKLMHSNETFDLFLYEVFVNDGLLGLAQHFKVPTIGFSTLGTTRWVHEFTGSPLPDSHVPHLLLGFSDRMSFLQRLINGVANLYEDAMLNLAFYPMMGNIYDRYVADPKPSFTQLRKSAISLVLLNHHISLSGAKPLMSNVVEAGGLHLPSKLGSLPPKLQAFMDNATEGVVYFSLGSNLKPAHMGPKREAIVKVLSSIPQKVVWKWDADEKVDPRKFFTSDWLPQNEILAHPNVRLFVTHGGLLSLMEAINSGVPVLGFAMFADQKMNLVKATEDGYGILIDYDNLTESSMGWGVGEILGNERYHGRAKVISERFRDRPQKGLETAKFWIEYVLRHGGAKFLQSSALKLSWFEFYNLDVVAFIVVVVFALLKGVQLAVRRIKRLLRKAPEKIKQS